MLKGSVGNNVSIHKDVLIDKNVVIGNNVTIYPHVSIGAGTRIFDNAVIGRPPMSAGNTTRPVDTTFHPLAIGKDCIIGASSVLYTNIKIGNNVLIGDLARIREGCTISNKVVVGGGVLVMYDTTIGEATRVIDGAILTGNMIIEDNVFIGPGINSINDNSVYLARFGIETLVTRGPIIRRFALIGAGANLAADIEIGEGSIVAPNAMVTHDVEPWTVVAGIPARYKRDITDQEKKLLINFIQSKET